MTSALFSPKLSFPQNWGFSPKKLFFHLVVHMYTLECIYDERSNVVEVMLMLWQLSLISDIQCNKQTCTGRLVVDGPGQVGLGRAGLDQVGPGQTRSGRAGAGRAGPDQVGPDFF